MPRTVENTVYKFDELSERAKEKAREWYRRGTDEDSWWSECVLEDAAQIAEILGIELKQHPVKLMGGTTVYKPCIWWSGFSCQGDGASYEGVYRRKPDAPKAIRAHASRDEKLHAIADDLDAQVSVESVRIVQSGNYYHEYSMDCTAYDEEGEECEAEVSKAYTEPLRAFAKWIYRSLEAEYTYRQSNEAVDDDIRANEYEFAADGSRHISI